MSDRWAALLANAANGGDDSQEVLPSFPEILRQLAPKDAALLDAVYDVVVSFPKEQWMGTGANLSEAQIVIGFTEYELAVSRVNLIRLGLCADPASGLDFTAADHRYPVVNSNILCLTEFGHAFVSACRI